MARVATPLRALSLAVRTAEAAVLAISAYQSAVTLAGYLKRREPPQPPAAWRPRFALVVCARDEEAVVARIVSDLLGQEYPAELRDVLVAAHNCTDGTAAAAEAAGARVIETSSPVPGKAWAIRAALDALGEGYDYLGVFDADARVEPGMLAAVARQGPGAACLQVETVPVGDPEWIAEGYGFGRRARNLFWWRPREALGLGTTISGCGWFIRPSLLREELPRITTLTEDLELTVRLALRGIPVMYVSAARVAVGEARDLGTSVRQRLRWVRGHLLVVRLLWPRLALRAVRGDARALDLALYLIAPTRMLTRLGASFAALHALLPVPAGLPRAAVLPVAAAEWAVPAVIAWRERLLSFNRRGFDLALRHSVLSLLWFPIGLWALLTAQVQAWAPTRRTTPEVTHGEPAAGR
jgi:cellulose synthase/poly-beta-1,6-N-acetylglucosamine synthase-like glycosyltransferase